jgi:hypothetical protein
MSQVNLRDPETLRRAMLPWLRDRLPDADEIMLPQPRKPDIGGSSETFFLSPVIRQAALERREHWVLRIEPRGYQIYKDPDIERQYLVMKTLSESAAVLVPSLLWYESHPATLGVPLFLMERVEGQALPSLHHSEGLLAASSPAAREAMLPSEGQIVLITGAVGAVGRFCMHAARRRGAHVVAAVRSGQADEALGAAEVIVLGDEPWNGDPFDHVADTVGGPAVKALCRHIVRGGRLRTVATTPIDPDGLPNAPIFVIVRNDPARLRRLAEEVATGAITVPIAKRLPLEAAAEAHRIVEAGGSGGKVILEP